MRNDTAEQRKKPMQSRENTEQSDFATVELWRRGDLGSPARLHNHVSANHQM